MKYFKNLIFIFAFTLPLLSAAQDSQRITGKVIVKTKEGEQPAAHVNVIVYNGKTEISRGKSLSDGSFQLFPSGAFHLVATKKYTVVVEADKMEKNQIGRRIKKSSVTVLGSEMTDIVIYSTLLKNRDKIKDERAGYFEGSPIR